MNLFEFVSIDVAAVFGKSLTTIGGEDEEAEHNVGIVHLDSDTAISKRSFDAALRAAGSLCQAVDMVNIISFIYLYLFAFFFVNFLIS